MIGEEIALQIIVVGAAAVVGGVAGWALLPKVADRVLKYKYKQVTDFWNEMFESYKKYKEKNEGFPSRKDKGDAGALRIWIDDQFLQASLGNLTKDQVIKLRDAGFNI